MSNSPSKAEDQQCAAAFFYGERNVLLGLYVFHSEKFRDVNLDLSSHRALSLPNDTKCYSALRDNTFAEFLAKLLAAVHYSHWPAVSGPRDKRKLTPDGEQ